MRKKISFSELLEVCAVYTVSENFVFFSETGGAEGEIILSDKSGDDSRIASVSKKIISISLPGFHEDIQFR